MQFFSNHFVDVVRVMVHFRPCVTGEFLNGQICEQCREGFYSFDHPDTFMSPAEMSEANVCQECSTVGVAECYGDQMLLAEGYWRISNMSDYVFECPLHEQACVGGAATGEDLCGEGYTGPLCAVCEEGYHFVRGTQKCETCAGGAIWLDATFILFVLCCIMAIGVGVVMYKQLSAMGANTTIDDVMVKIFIQIGQISGDDDHATNIGVMRATRTKWMGSIKIYVTLYQVINILPFVLDFQFPTSYADVVSVVSLLVFSISEVASFTTCSFNSSMDFITKLYVDTIFPLVFVFVVLVACRVHISAVKLRHHRGQVSPAEGLVQQISSISSKYFMTIPMMLNLVLPNLTATLFATFSCTDTDPTDTLPGDHIYMTADMSISCTTDRYLVAELWASLNILFYCALLPSFYFYELYIRREDIYSRDVPALTPDADEARKLRIRPVRVLFDVYKPEMWFWEIIEMFWKMLMTGILVLVARGSAQQIVAGIVISFLYSKALAACQPFCEKTLQYIKEVTVLQVTCILFVALLIRTDVFEADSSKVIVVLLLLLCLNFFAELYIRVIYEWLLNNGSALATSLNLRGKTGSGEDSRGERVISMKNIKSPMADMVSSEQDEECSSN